MPELPPNPDDQGSAALYSSDCTRLNAESALDFDDAIRTRPMCRLLYDAPVPGGMGLASVFTVDLVLCLPAGPGPHPLADSDLAALVSVADRGGAIAIHAAHAEAVEAAAKAILAMSGGGHA